MMDVQLTTLVSAALDIIADPTSNLTAAVFLMAAVVLLVLIVILAAIIVILPAGSRRSAAAPRAATDVDPGVGPGTSSEGVGTSVPLARAAHSSSGVHVLSGRRGAWVIVALSMAALASAYIGTAQDSYCLTCHSEVRPEGYDSRHADVACVRCHEDALAVLSNTARRAQDIAAHYGIGGSSYSAQVPSSRCYSCHRDIDDAVTRNEETGVMMSHAEPLGAGYSCANCHRSDEHPDMGMPVGMSVCLACHDAVQASAECDTCHAKDASAASGLAAERICGTATITRTDCEGCHSMESCDACHGLRMPHSEEFLRTHPRYSGFDLKDLCFEQCHTQADCGKCHGAWSNHPPSFKEEHKRLPEDSACDTCHGKHEGPICDLCHDFNQ